MVSPISLPMYRRATLQSPEQKAAPRVKRAQIQRFRRSAGMPPSLSTRASAKAGAFKGSVPTTESMVQRMIWGLTKEKATVPTVARARSRKRRRRSSAAAATRPKRLPFQGRFIRTGYYKPESLGKRGPVGPKATAFTP
jgi:hypothetical protein